MIAQRLSRLDKLSTRLFSRLDKLSARPFSCFGKLSARPFSCFDKLSTGGCEGMTASPPLILSLSKDVAHA